MTNLHTDKREFRDQIFRSKLSYTDLPRAAQRTLPYPDEFLDEMPAQPHRGVAMVFGNDYLPTNLDGQIAHHVVQWVQNNTKTPFKPFRIVRDGQVIASAFLKDGEFSIHGRLTNRLGEIMTTAIRSYAKSPKWAGYTYIEDMISAAMLASIKTILRYDERKNTSPLSFITTDATFSFIKFVKREKQLGEHRKIIIDSHYDLCQWSVFNSDSAEEDNSMDAIYDEICAHLDLTMKAVLDRRLAGKPHATKKAVWIQNGEPVRLKMSPTLLRAIKYGEQIGLQGIEIANALGLDVATISRARKGIVRKRGGSIR